MSIDSILAALKNLRMLVIGDIMLDHYVWGDVNRISPEAPVPVVHVNRETYTPGGAANVAINAAALGMATSLIGVIGSDDAGVTLQKLLEKHHVCAQGSLLSADAATIIKTRVMARNQQLCRIDRESPAHRYARLDAGEMSEAIQAADVIILSDYAKGVFSQELLDAIIGLSSRHNKLLAMDPKPSRMLDFKNIGLITPNRQEALLLAGLPEPGQGEEYPLEKICATIDRKFSPRLLVVTLGADGMAVCRKGKVEDVLPTRAQEVFDVSGAGDTVIATLSAALAAGAEPREAAQFANHAAGIVVSKMGTAHITPEEMRASL